MQTIRRIKIARPEAKPPISHAGGKIPSKTRLSFTFIKSLPRSYVSLGALIGVSVVVGFLALNHAHSKSVQPKPQTQISSTIQKQSNSTNKTSALGANTSTASKTAQAPSYTYRLPTNFHVNNDVQNLGNGVISFSIGDDNKNTYPVIQQPPPANFSQDAFAKSLTNVERFTTSLGSVVIGENKTELFTSIQTPDNRWILIESAGTDLRTQLETIAKSL